MLHLLAAVTFTSTPHNLLWVSGVVGFFLPHLVAIINQTHWRPGLKSVLAAIACLVAGAIVCWAEDKLDFTNLLTSAGVVWTFTVTSYKGLWKPTQVIDALEAATTIRKTPPPATP